MAYRDASESMSLHSLEHTDSFDGNQEFDSNLDADEEDERPPACFTDHKTILETPPVLSGHYRPVRKLYRAGRRPRLIVGFIWMSIVAHTALVTHFDHSEAQFYHRWTPPIIATLLVTSTATLSNQEIHHWTQKPGRQQGLVIYYLRILAGMVICIICPMLSVPLFDTYTVRDETTRHGPFLDVLQLSSWADLLPKLQFPSPILVDKMQEQFWNDWAISSIDKWMLPHHEHALAVRFPDLVTFDLPRNGRGPDESRWNDWQDSEIRAVWMPLLPLSAPEFDNSRLRHEWHVENQAIMVGLDCEYIDIRKTPLLQHSEGVTSVMVNLTDKDDCTTRVSLTGSPLTTTIHEEMLMVLYWIEQEILDDLKKGRPLPEQWEKLHQAQRDLLLKDIDLISYKPTITVAESSLAGTKIKDVCRSKLFFAGLTDVLWELHKTPSPQQVQAASCQTRFHLVEGNIVFGQSRRGFFYDQAEFVTNSGVVIDDVSVKNTQLWDADPRRPDGSPIVWDGGDVTRNLSEVFLRRAAHFSVDYSKWPLTQSRERIGDLIWKREHPVGTLLMIMKALREDFAAEMSNAAGLALQEKLSDRSIAADKSEYSLEQADLMLTRQMERSSFQARMLFRICLYLVTIIISYCLFDLDRLIKLGTTTERTQRVEIVEDSHDEDDFQVPWDISSIAARLALLRYSRVREWLKQQSSSSFVVEDHPPIKVGQWLVHKDQGPSGWRIDAPNIVLNNMRLASTTASNVPTMSQSTAQYHPPLSSSPLFATERAAWWIGAALVVYCVLQYTALASQPVGTTVGHQQKLMAMLLGTSGPVDSPSFWWMLLSVVFPASVIYAIAFVWLPWLYAFYKIRRPWISLESPQPAHLSLTLDYWNSRIPLWKALRNRHWDVAALAIVCFISLVVPISHACLSGPLWRESSLEEIHGTKDFGWRTNYSDFVPPQTAFDYAFRDFFKFLNSIDNLATWSSHETGLLPITFTQQDIDSEADYWLFNTSYIQGSLECHKAQLQAELIEHSGPHGALYSVERARLSSNEPTEPMIAHLEQPCVGEEEYVGSEEYRATSTNSPKRSFCSRWWLHNAASTESNTKDPRWLIALIWGPATLSNAKNEILFTSAPSTLALVCRPVAKLGRGTVVLSAGLSSSRQLKHAHVVRFTPWKGKDIEMLDLARAISHGLNHSMSHINGTEGGVLAQNELISSDRFVGDLLSYAFYRYGLASSVGELDFADLQHDASLIFSTYVNSLAVSSNVLKTPSDEVVDVQPYEIPGSRQLNITAFAAMLICVLLFLAVCFTLGTAPESRFLPFAPEPLLNSLLLLCHSKLVGVMETEIPHPERLSLEKFYKRIESWGWAYQLGTVVHDGTPAKIVVDTVEELGTEEYRDDP